MVSDQKVSLVKKKSLMGEQAWHAVQEIAKTVVLTSDGVLSALDANRVDLW